MSRDLDRIDWTASLPFLAAHAVALATPFLAPASWRWLALAAALYAVRMFAVTAGYHRYFSHRSFRTSRAFQLVLAFLGGTAAQRGALWWAAHHRDHHRHSDRPEDVHSPLQRGFWWSHVGWILSRRHHHTKLDRVRDLARYPELRWLDRHHLVPPAALALALFVAGGVPALLWGFFVSTVLLWHGTFVINSLAHVLGRARYETGDGSRNSLLLAIVRPRPRARRRWGGARRALQEHRDPGGNFLVQHRLKRLAHLLGERVHDRGVVRLLGCVA